MDADIAFDDIRSLVAKINISREIHDLVAVISADEHLYIAITLYE